jgi:glycosyltransferase involved in cell wall biosynthesis
MTFPKITVITPSYNQGQYIESTILSVLAQNYPNLEYFIFDGGSTDNSVEIIKKYTDNITFWESGKDKGQSDAINKGFKKATGDIVTWLNSDDQFTPNTLHAVASYFENNPTKALIHGQTIMFGYKIKENTNGGHTEGLPERYLSGMPFPQPSAFFRKKVLDEQGILDESLHYAMDYDLFVRVALNYDSLRVDDIFSKYLVHPSSKTATSNVKFADEWAKIFSKVLRSFSFTSQLIAEMKSIGLYHEASKKAESNKSENDKYTVNKHFDEPYLRKAFYYALYYQVYFRYEDGQMGKVKEIIRFLKEKAPEFVTQHQLDKIYLRASIPFSKQLIQFVRNITR